MRALVLPRLSSGLAGRRGTSLTCLRRQVSTAQSQSGASTSWSTRSRSAMAIATAVTAIGFITTATTLFSPTYLLSSPSSSSTPPNNTDSSVKTEFHQPTPREVQAWKAIADDTSQCMRDRMVAFVKALQVDIVNGLNELDPSTTFRRDTWQRQHGHGGHGVTCVLQQGEVFEKAAVNVSVVHGMLPPAAVKRMRAGKKIKSSQDPSSSSSTSLIEEDEDKWGWWKEEISVPFFAAGISLIVHPVNPFAPTVHLNYRYFEVQDPNDDARSAGGDRAIKAWWFGGGTDLTPSYLNEEDAIHFHQTIKKACDAHDATYYRRFKKWCDTYFYIPHRREARGVGGIFFDNLSASSTSPQESLFAFIRDCGESFLPSYLPIIQRRAWTRYSDAHYQWQQLRRGRYVEFNLTTDRGTKFGLATPSARIESILVSLPLTARWEYMSDIGMSKGNEEEADSEEAKMLDVLRHPREWA